MAMKVNDNDKAMLSQSELEQYCAEIKGRIHQLETELNQLKSSKADISHVLYRLATLHIELSRLREQAKAQSLPFEDRQ